MGLVCPYFYLLAAGNGDADRQRFNDPRFETYSGINWILMGACIFIFTWNILFDENKVTRFLQQPLLGGLFCWGNVSAVEVIVNPYLPFYVRALCIAAISNMVIGYAVFYISYIPERFFAPGAADGKIWNSHVIWHSLSSIAQLCYALVPILYGNKVLVENRA